MKWLFLIMPALAFANIQKAPNNFKDAKGQKYVFVDFLSAESSIDYDLDRKMALATTTIKFQQETKGRVLLDLIPKPIQVEIDGTTTQSLKITTPDKETSLRSLETVTSIGEHTLTITNEIKENIDFGNGFVNSAFWMTDLDDKSYLEQYLPTNLEYDQYPLHLEINIASNSKTEDHEIFTNGSMRSKNNKNFIIDYPEYFTASSVYFHLTRKDRFSKKLFNHITPAGKMIPITIYSKYSWYLSRAEKTTKSVLDELETKLGTWPHSGLVAYIAGSGGMEYSGATITSNSALGHEITHSYFARGVMPQNGNSGWIDEAIASWRDNGYQSHSTPRFASTNMSGHSEYRRYTDRRAYTQGASFMAYLNSKLEPQGGLAPFLKDFHQNYTHTTISTKLFQKEIENYSGIDFKQDFATYIFGNNRINSNKELTKENPYHPKLSKKQLADLL